VADNINIFGYVLSRQILSIPAVDVLAGHTGDNAALATSGSASGKVCAFICVSEKTEKPRKTTAIVRLSMTEYLVRVIM